MKIYLATRGEYSDFRICHAFFREEDALSYALGDDVMELELRDGPVEVRKWHTLWWRPDLGNRESTSLANANPYEASESRDYDGDERHCDHRWQAPGAFVNTNVLTVGGWDINRVRKAYSEQRAQYRAGKEAQ